MADPFSIAGSAVGVISLGIVACEQLFALVDNVKTARDKAEAIRASLDSLETHLEELEIVLKRLDPTTPIAATSAAVLACNAALARIRHRLPGSNAKDSRIPSNFRSLSFHLSYPLKKADLEYLQSLAKDVHRELQTAQLTMLIDQGRLNTERLEDTISSQSDRIQRTLADQQHNLETAIDSRFSQQTRLVQNSFQHLGSETALVRSDVTQLYSALQPVPSGILQLSLLQESLSRLESKINKLDPIRVALRAGHSGQKGQQDLNRKLNNFQSRNAAFRRAMPLCNCRKQMTSVTFFQWPAALSRSVSQVHLADCPYNMTDDVITNIDLRISLCSTVLRRKFNMAIQFSSSLTRGFSIRAGLRPIAIVGDDSPAFVILRDFWWNHDELTIPDSWKRSAAQLHRLFETREASPHDILSSGRTLMHGLCVHQSKVAGNLLYDQSQARVDNFVGLAGYLLRCMGTTAQERDDSGRSCIRYCEFYPLWSQFLAQLLEHDVPIPSEKFARPSRNELLWLENTDLYKYDHLTSFSETYIAILMKDGARFSTFVSSGKALLDSQQERCSLFEMAVMMSWPEGCRILLDEGVNVENRQRGRGFLSWVIVYGNVDTLRFWLEIRPYLDPNTLENLGSLEYALSQVIEERDFLYRVDAWDRLPGSSEKISLVIASLAAQRRSLDALAGQHLHETEYPWRNNDLLDIYALRVCKALEAKGVVVPASLKPSSRCVYTALGEQFPDLYVLDALHDAGFRDVIPKIELDEQPDLVIPLLFYLRHSESKMRPWRKVLSVVEWFLAKGSSLDQAWPDSSIRGLHLLGWWFGFVFYRAEWPRFDATFHTSTGLHDWITKQYSSSGQINGGLHGDKPQDYSLRFRSVHEYTDATLWHRITDTLTDQTSDLCDCYCSKSGCVPMGLLCKRFVVEFLASPKWYTEHGMGTNLKQHCPGIRLDTTLQIVAERISLLGFLKASTNRWLISELIRFFTFSKLEIRHTCCHLDGSAYYEFEPLDPSVKPGPHFSPTEMQQIHQEDQHLIQVLEKLLPELEKAYDNLGQNFDVFLEKYMMRRINKVLVELANEDHEKFSEGRRALGVAMEPMPGHMSNEEVEGGEEDGQDQESSDEDKFG